MARPTSTAVPARLRALQSLDRLAGAALLALLPAAPPDRGGPLPAEAVRRVLVVRPGGLGDAILLWPALRELRAAWPAAEIDVLAEARNAAAFALPGPGVGVVRYDAAPLAALRRLRARRYDLVIDTEQYHHLQALVARWARPRWSAGFATLGRGRLLTHPVPHSEDDYEAESFLRLAAAVTGREGAFDADAPFLAPAASDLAWADAALAGGGGGPVAAVMPGAGSPYRLWPVERYAEAARRLAARGLRVVVLGGQDAVAAGRAIAAAAPGTLDLAGRATLGQGAAVLARAAVALCADSGVLHLARAVGTPTVALFGSGLHRKWAPRGRAHVTVRLGLPCSPCIRSGRLPPCPYDVACMTGIGVDEVEAALGRALAAGPRP